MKISQQLWDDLVAFFDDFYEYDFDRLEGEVTAFRRRLANVERKAQPVRPVRQKEG